MLRTIDNEFIAQFGCCIRTIEVSAAYVFEAAADAFGEKYGFTFAGTGESLRKLRRRLKAGQTVVTHVPGHYVTIVDYNPNTKKYLLLDPHYLPKRKTCPYGDWVSAKTLTGDSLFAYIFFFYEKTY